MKRISKKIANRYQQMWRIWPPLFWKQCLMCREEFRREWGWSAVIGPFISGQGRRGYLCSSCAPDEQTASDILSSHAYIPRPSFMPPAPPRPR